jgi:hypothetical protein
MLADQTTNHPSDPQRKLRHPQQRKRAYSAGPWCWRLASCLAPMQILVPPMAITAAIEEVRR